MRKVSSSKNSHASVLKTCQKKKIHSVSGQKDFRLMPCEIVISEDIFKSTPEYQLTCNKDVKYLLEPKKKGWILQKPSLTQNDNSDPDPFAKD